MLTIPDTVDDKGDIQLHGRQGIVIPVNFTNDDGTPRDMTGVNVTFECGTGVNLTLTAGSTSDEMLITIDNATVKTIFGQDNKEFAVIDHSGTEPTPVWLGTVYIYGWVE